MTKNAKPLTALALGIAAMGLFSAQAVAGSDGDSLKGAGLTTAEVQAIVTEAGYTFEEAEFEDGVIEAEGMKDGVEWELTLDDQSGEILKVEEDD